MATLTTNTPSILTHLFVVSALALLSACGGGGGGEPSTSAPAPATASATASPNSVSANSVSAPSENRPVPQTDLEIAQALYTDSARTPSGFYSEGPAPTTGYVSTTHLKSTDIATNAATQFELCTDDFSQALTWSEQAAHTAPQYADLIGNTSNSRYFEFQRVRSSQPTAIQRARIYKCSYVDRGSVDLRVASSIAGQMNRKPATADDLKEFSEYVWQFTYLNNYGNAVLKSSGVTTSNGLQHTLVIASIGAATSSGCDRIDVKSWTHSLDTQSGELVFTTTTLWTFIAKRVGGYAELCAN